MPEPPVNVSRGGEDAEHVSSLSPLEERLIVVGQGIEKQDSQFPAEFSHYRIPDYLQREVPGAVFTSERSGTYVSTVQGIRFAIRITTRKDEFKRYVETPGIHVIYDGHARYGRGPCFGDNPNPGEDWENGVNPAVSGLYRMAYSFMAIPVEDVLHHRYTANPVRTSVALPREECHPDLRRIRGRLGQYTLQQLHSELPNRVAGPVDPNDKFWGYRGRLGGHAGPHIVLHAGWSNTASHPMDLGATDIQCRVFCHFGCSTFIHNYRILRFYKNWQRTEDDRFAYWTTAPSYFEVTRLWIKNILKYDRFNAFQSWRPSLEYAVRKTKRDLRNFRDPGVGAFGRHYQVI